MDQPLPPPSELDEARFVAQWIDQRHVELGILGFKLVAAYHAVSLIVDHFFVVGERQKQVMLTFHLGFLVLGFLVFLLYRKDQRWPRWVNLPSQLSFVGWFSLVFMMDVEAPPYYSANALKSAAAYLIMTSLCIISTPYSGLLVTAILFASYIGYGAFILYALPQWTEIIGIFSLGLGAACILRHLIIQRTAREGMLAFAAQQAAIRAERARSERDLELASEIQDSMLPPSALSIGDWNIKTHLVKHSRVGGDWAGVLPLADGRVICAVVDAAGKGVQAALVAHAVQSIWVDHAERPNFSVDQFIQSVNRVLYRLGQRMTHAVTMGIVEVAPSGVRYWSAGHTPLFVIEWRDEEAHPRSVSRQGMMLGISEEVDIQPITVDIAANAKADLLLVSDGLVTGRPRRDLPHIARLAKDLQGDAEGALRAVAIDDDKTVVHMRSAVHVGLTAAG